LAHERLHELLDAVQRQIPPGQSDAPYVLHAGTHCATGVALASHTQSGFSEHVAIDPYLLSQGVQHLPFLNEQGAPAALQLEESVLVSHASAHLPLFHMQLLSAKQLSSTAYLPAQDVEHELVALFHRQPPALTQSVCVSRPLHGSMHDFLPP